MNKTELRDIVAKKVGMGQKDTGIVLDSILDTIEEGLIEDGRVSIMNFFTLEVKERAARMGRNPQTGEPLEIPKRNAVTLRVSENLKKKVNQ